jgi:hypothetical protein
MPVGRRHAGYQARVIVGLLQRMRLRASQLHAMSLSSIALCIVLWIRAKTIGEDERGNAERRALFVGLWPTMFWLLGDAVERKRRRWL